MTLTDEEIEAIRLEWDGVRGTVPLQKFAMKYIPALLSALEAEKKRADEAEALLKDANTPYTQRDIGNLVFDGNSVSFWRDKAKAYGGAASALRARADEAEAELAKVTDPNAVHVNMLRGTIAKPSVAQIKHLYGDAIADPAELARLREENERYREAARGQLVVVNTASSRIKELEAEVGELREALEAAHIFAIAEKDMRGEVDDLSYPPPFQAGPLIATIAAALKENSHDKG